MTVEILRRRLQKLARERLPLPAGGATPARLKRLVEVGEEDLSLAKLIEAHWDAVAILAEAGRKPEPGVYGVWASEIPAAGLILTERTRGSVLSGSKPFCSGLGIVDRVLITVREPRALLLDLDMRRQEKHVRMDLSAWATEAFRATNTGAITFENFPITKDNFVGGEDFYLRRPGFWHGACGPAACWAGGAAGLVSFAKGLKRDDAHTLAHLGAMDATLWMMKAALEQAGTEIDHSAEGNAMVRALRLRHVVEQGCTDILHRFSRAYGPHPLAMNSDISRRCHELDLYLRQSHAERDLECLGKTLKTT